MLGNIEMESFNKFRSDKYYNHLKLLKSKANSYNYVLCTKNISNDYS